MKLKSLTLATLAALYGAGVAAAIETGPVSPAATSMGNSQNTVTIKQITADKINRVKGVSSEPQQQQGRLNTIPGGLNQHLRPASSRDKFVAEPERTGEDVYIVRLKDQPIATYNGGVNGYQATAKSVIKKELVQQALGTASAQSSRVATQVNINEADVEGLQQSRVASYKNYLAVKQNAVVNQARGLGVQSKVRANFTTAMNGFSMTMTQAQAKQLASLPQVEFVQRSTMQQIQTDRGPTFIGADQVWAGNTVTNLPQKGEGIIVGIIDTGINSDHVSFADVGDDGYDHTNPLGKDVYLGDCATDKVQCNDKLIGVYSWPVVTDTYKGMAPATGEDIQGHGSHTAGTTAGNYIKNVPALAPSLGDGDGIPMGYNFASASGVAPHANIISYQVCIPEEGCPTEALVKAYEQAIEDGVDVINFSIGGGENFPWEDATELAILSAREAGISVAVAAGNSGTDARGSIYFGSLGHTAPWEMVVAASTHDRVLDITHNLISFTGGNYPPYIFIDPAADYDDDIAGYSIGSIADGIPVRAADFGDEQCLEPFPAGTFTADQIVICKRGINARVTKAINVQAGGAGGFILYNEDWYSGITNEEQKIYDDVFPLPGIHLTFSAGNSILNWMNDGAADHKISIIGGSVDSHLDAAKGDILAKFSSLGPVTRYKHHLSPNIAAPGVSILAPYADQHPLAPNSAQSQDWAFLDGTSMATPHVAGVMALVRQAHRDWTAAEVQSALQMTASQTVRRDVTPENPEGFPATQHRAGSGRVDAKAAVNAGLIMDETVENFKLANPHQGGDVRQLNLPQLMDSNCRGGVCSWVRTVTATRDGDWTVSADDFVYDRWNNPTAGEIDMHGAKMEFFPASFSLKAGESQSIVIKADITDIQYQHNSILSGSLDLEGVELWTNVNLIASDASIPKSHWPVSINFDRQGLPEAVNVAVHRDNGSYHLAGLPLPASNDVVYRGHGPVKADITEVTLPQDNNHIPVWWPEPDTVSTEHNQTTIVNVPEGSARFVVEVLAHTAGPGESKYHGSLAGSLAVHIGRDTNGNGVADFDDEWLCSSTTQIEQNYCSFTNPDAGDYWVLLSNTSINVPDWDVAVGPDPYGYLGVTADMLVDSYKVATAIVPAGENGLTVAGPVTTDGNPVDVDLNWSLDELTEGDIAYAGIEIGSSTAPGSAGFIPLKLIRGVDDVSVSNNNQVRGGDIVNVAIHVTENNSGADRDFDLSTVIPAGITLVPGSVKVNNVAQQANLSLDGNTIRIAGVQPDSTHWKRSYNVTNSETDPLCRVPNYGSNSDKFIGLHDNYGYRPDFGGASVDWANGVYNADYTEFDPTFDLNLGDFWDTGSMNLFHNEEYKTYSKLMMSPQGFVYFGRAAYAGQHLRHRNFPYIMTPYGPFIGVMWKGAVDPTGPVGNEVPLDALGTPLHRDNFDLSNDSGMTIGRAYDPANNIDDIVIEWVNARSQGVALNTWFGSARTTGTEKNDRYTFDLILSKGYRYGAGQFELTMAYDKVDFAGEPALGAIGLHGNYGPLDIFGLPYGGYETGISYAYDDLDQKIKKGMVVCYDYTGPEATQFDVNFQVRIAETAAGQTLNLDVVSVVSGMGEVVLANPITIAGNITLAAFNDVIVDENESFDITVAYADVEPNPNLISVSGEHITAVVNNHSAGSSVTITPDANWHGETEVQVTVADSLNSADKAVRTFMLTVNSDGVEPVAPEKPAEPAKNSSGGGALGWLVLLLAPVAMVRRRKL